MINNTAAVIPVKWPRATAGRSLGGGHIQIMLSTAAALGVALARLPRAALATLPTPLVEAPRLADAVGIHRLFVKRDDLTGLAFGGNKVRQMEFFLGEALAEGADLLIAGGSVDQSNHARVAAAAARAVGLRSLIVARPGGRHPGPQGNGLLSRLLADEFVILEELADAPTDRLAEIAHRRIVFERLASERRSRGERPYVLTGSSVPLGAMGYVAGALELAVQLDAAGLDDPIVAVTSAGATQAGLEVANRLLGEPFRILGLSYLPTGGHGPGWIAEIATSAATLLGYDLPVDPGTVMNDDRSSGPGYGVLTAVRREAINLAARLEGLLLDPVYTASGMAGLIRRVREGMLGREDTVAFIHTGGLPALFSYGREVLSGEG
jgi:1-aminocyclopropane-1-carboxylate deaminase/D-cysteine desulfhydrase-like pyridoxal-dependent ACC family enzyme